MLKVLFACLFFAGACVANDFGQLATLNAQQIAKQSQEYIALHLPNADPEQLVLFDIQLHYSPLIEGGALLQATYINLGHEHTGDAVAKRFPSFDEPSETSEVMFTEYYKIELSFDHDGNAVNATEHKDFFPEPPEGFWNLIKVLKAKQ